MPVYFQFPERHIPDGLPPGVGRRIFQEFFLAVEDGTAVRGGYILKTQDCWIDGQVQTIGNLQLPLSEGIVDPRYGFVGVQLVLNAQQRQSSLYSLGMGGLDNPYPKLLKGMGWSLVLIPFYFRVVRPSRFFRGMPYLRSTPMWRLACDLLAWSGAGWIGVRVAQSWAGRRTPRPMACQAEVVPDFGDWADEVWEASRQVYGLVANRDRQSLEILFSRSNVPGLIVLRINRGGRTIGWAAVLDTSMSRHRYFGKLRVGSIVDGFAAPEDAAAVVRAATEYLERRRVDVIVSNQLHRSWVAGLRASGFLAGPSNFALALSKPLARRAVRYESDWGDFHFNRGDGDGPINL
jgi:hypothetical protein